MYIIYKKRKAKVKSCVREAGSWHREAVAKQAQNSSAGLERTGSGGQAARGPPGLRPRTTNPNAKLQVSDKT